MGSTRLRDLRRLVLLRGFAALRLAALPPDQRKGSAFPSKLFNTSGRPPHKRQVKNTWAAVYYFNLIKSSVPLSTSATTLSTSSSVLYLPNENLIAPIARE